MALIVRVQPVAGDSAPINLVNSSAFTGATTPTLIDEGSEKAWQIATGTLLKTPASHTVTGANDNTGLTIVLRFKRTLEGTNSFLPLAGLLVSGAAPTDSASFSGGGANAYRGRLGISGVGQANLSSKALNTIHTFVWRFKTSSAGTSDLGSIWFNRVGRVGDTADAVSSLGNAGTTAFVEAFINCDSSASWNLLDFLVYNTEESDAQCAALADNVRTVVPAPTGGTTPITFSGTIPNQTFTAGQAVSVDLSTYFTGTQTPFTFAASGTSLAGTGLSITSAGLLTGTATEGGVVGVTITGTDADLATAVSNTFNVTVNAAATPLSFTGTVPAISGTQNSAITPVDTSTYFSGSLTPFSYSLFSGTLPTGVTLNTSTGIISGTPTVSFSGNIVVRATDTGSNVANSNSIAVNIAAATADGTITLADLKNNTATPLASTSGFYVTILSATNPKTVVYNTSSVSSNASAAITFTNASIVQGTEYRYFIEKDGTAFAAGKVTAT